MNEAEPSTTVWFKSSHSGTEGGQCVEVAHGTTAVRIRDSKTATGPVLTVSPSTWTEFISLAWAKSSYSGAEGGDCVEVARGKTVVHVRDSKAATRPALTLSLSAWTEFVGLASKEC
ncbi:DUF397 domain-containing protein [Streptomyces sp. NPDC059575]|uniref:DUF397 domain-containing protein n=1 Tax=Streptomyces sp. NPDC059575 TaxID=3346872 RepID=UPI00368B4DAA